MSTQAYDIVKLARSNKRPTGLDYIQNLCGDFLELHGDRCYADDAAIVGGVGHFRGIPVTFVAIEKGHSAKERMSRFFGAPHPEGYRKALRLMRQAEKFHRPVLCFVDTSGAYCGIGAEERGQGQAIAENLMGMMSLNTPVITLLIGEGGSGGALALSVADRVWMLENAVYSVRLTARDALELGIIEKIIPERDLGQPAFYGLLADRLEKELHVLMGQEDLLQRRYARFRAFGSPKPLETQPLVGVK